MFFKRRGENQDMGCLFIHAERSSVCMGDDCTAPNPADLPYEPNQRLSEFIPTIINYVPKMKDSWWEVRAGKQLLATVYFNALKKPTYKLDGPDIRVNDIPDRKIFCRYNY